MDAPVTGPTDRRCARREAGEHAARRAAVRSGFVALLLVLADTITGSAGAKQLTDFDHLTTGFELQGVHRDMACEFCHVNGVFKGTPRTCGGCHSIGSPISATQKPVDHVPTSDNCVVCHARFTFAPLVWFDHADSRGTCFGCHDNVRVDGKEPDHIPSGNNCDACHTTNAWLPARMDHGGVAAASCGGCHRGIRAASKPATHLPTSATCDTCHTTVAWRPARFDHGTVVTGDCRSCHNGTTAIGKTAGHLSTAADCSACHRYPNWSPAQPAPTNPGIASAERAAPPRTTPRARLQQ